MARRIKYPLYTVFIPFFNLNNLIYVLVFSLSILIRIVFTFTRFVIVNLNSIARIIFRFFSSVYISLAF